MRVSVKATQLSEQVDLRVLKNNLISSLGDGHGHAAVPVRRGGGAGARVRGGRLQRGAPRPHRRRVRPSKGQVGVRRQHGRKVIYNY